MPKLRKYEAPKFTFYIHPKTPIHFANVIGQETYIKNRVDRLRIKNRKQSNGLIHFHTTVYFLTLVLILASILCIVQS